MAKKNKNIDEIIDTEVTEPKGTAASEPKKTNGKEQAKRKGFVRDIISGSFLSKQFLSEHFIYIIFITALGLLYIKNKYSAETINRNIVKVQQQIKDLRDEKISVQSELMALSKRSEVIKSVEKHRLGLNQLVVPPNKIVVNK